jgi:hypothetical protein
MTLSLKFSGQRADDAMPVVGRTSRIAVSKTTGIFLPGKNGRAKPEKKDKRYDCG